MATAYYEARMFFLAKSALCIGIVAVVAAGSAGEGTIRATLASGSREAAASIGRACAASSGCVGLGTRIAAAAIGQSDGLASGAMVRAAEALAAPEASILAAPAPAPGRSLRQRDRPLRQAVVAGN